MTKSTIEENKAAMSLVHYKDMVDFIKSKSNFAVKSAWHKYEGNLPWAYWLYLYTFENKK